MSDNDTHGETGVGVETDGGTASGAGRKHRETDYLTAEVNLLRPGTPFMRDHLKVIWTGFVAWLITVFGPVTATAIAPGVMTTQLPVIGFPLHYFLVAIGGPGGALIFSFWYARRRDKLDEKYGIDHAQSTEGPDSGGAGGATATDGGEQR